MATHCPLGELSVHRKCGYLDESAGERGIKIPRTGEMPMRGKLRLSVVVHEICLLLTGLKVVVSRPEELAPDDANRYHYDSHQQQDEYAL